MKIVPDYKKIKKSLDKNCSCSSTIVIPTGSNEGDSAYEVAVDNGFVGTEEEWLLSLVGEPGGSISLFEYLYIDIQEAPPIAGTFRSNNIDAETSTVVWINKLDADNTDRKPLLLIGDVGNIFYVQDKDDSTIYARYNIVTDAVDNGDYITIGLSYLEGSGDLIGDNLCILGIIVRGAKGEKGDKGDTGDTGPQGEQGIQGEEGKSAYETALDNGFVGTEEEWLASMKGETGEQGIPGDQGIQGEQGEQGIQGIPGLPGPPGEQGEQGEQGPQGEAGIDGGQTEVFAWAFDNVTTAADPGIGKFRLNNTVDFGAMTFVYIDDVTYDIAMDVSAMFAEVEGSWLLHIQQSNDATRFVQFDITGLLVDMGGWWKIPITHIQHGTGGIVNGQKCTFVFVNKNGEGTGGAGVTDGDKGDVIVSGSGSSWLLDPNLKKDTKGVTVDGMGSVIIASNTSYGYALVPYACTVTGWDIIADLTGNAVFDVKVGASSIIGAGNKPTLSSAQSNTAAISGWTTSAISANSRLEFIAVSAGIVTRVTVTIFLTKT